MMPRRTASLVAMATLLHVLPVAAQPQEAQRSKAAETLFEEAVALVSQGKFADACPKLEEVIRLEPAGVGAKLRLADCYEQGGRLASAWTAYLAAAEAAAAAKQEPRASFARERAGKLASRVPRMVILVSPEVAAVPGLEIRRDGVALDRSQWAAPLPVDPGPHAVAVSAPGKTSWSESFTLAADKPPVTVKVPVLADAAAAGAAAPTQEATAPSARVADVAPPPDASVAESGGVPTWAWIAGGAGLVFAGVAVGFLVDERMTQSTIDGHCDKTTCETNDEFDPDEANTHLYRSFGLFVGFGAASVLALGASAIGILTAPPSSKSATAFQASPWISPTSAGLGFNGRF
jgi:hypothetical protein